MSDARILVIAEQEKGHLSSATARVMAAASKLGGQVDVLVTGSQAGEAAQTAARLTGVAGVICVEDDAFDHMLAENMGALITSLAGPYTHLLCASTTSGRNVMPRVAALLGVGQISDVIAIESEDTFVRPIYAGSVLATVRSLDDKKVITIRPTAFEPVGEQSAASVSSADSTGDQKLVTFVEEQLAGGERPELGGARVIISGGRGLGSAENFRLIEGVADRLGAAVGASRAAVDAGYVPNDLQVGQTGKMVAPELYIAAGISGAVQHLAGMKDSRVIVAINSDEEAPIFQVADYGLVADLFEALPELERKL
ncbi:electron transfer flavoprotein subunit alpha/FixB family protein [Kushneria marisflavi]|uniref:Electron transfer flavoprotein subunit alpha n=1 Tax=Kushneria marisflavi TaxID=157779 RepID=A0A240UJZ7_9GAMM|nr:FAD-binding protein [Kushneria marisflavi]ART61798.1 electron transfer flavoprotein subunit alpha [Kushneria marisflavi]RKD86830.1 electron transfer flavoprotein alpha subunit apoprotein [Kushneria marisflavi]